jgi:hypothetical protein
MRRLCIFLVLAFGAVPADAAYSGTPASVAILKLNEQRIAAGLPLVRESAEWSAACRAHDHYAALNEWDADNPHKETPGKPGFSEAGDQAARRAILHRGSDVWADSNPWESAPSHLMTALAPWARAFGFDASEGYMCLATVPDGIEVADQSALYPYPPDGAKDVYFAEEAAEWPATPGELIGVTGVTGPYLLLLTDGPFVRAPLRFTQASVVGPEGLVAISTVASTDVAPANRFLVRSPVIIPLQPLRKATTYEVKATVTDGTTELSAAWSFSTGVQALNVAAQETVEEPIKLAAEISSRRFSGNRASDVRLKVTLTGDTDFLAVDVMHRVGRAWLAQNNLVVYDPKPGSRVFTGKRLFDATRLAPGAYSVDVDAAGAHDPIEIRFTVTR